MGSVFLTFYNEKAERTSTSPSEKKGGGGAFGRSRTDDDDDDDDWLKMEMEMEMEMEMVVTLTSFCFGYDSWMVGAACRAGDFSHFRHLSLQDRIERDIETKQRHGQRKTKRKRKRKSIIISFIFLLFFDGWPQQLWVFCRIICPRNGPNDRAFAEILVYIFYDTGDFNTNCNVWKKALRVRW